jgi:hypothetical protein
LQQPLNFTGLGRFELGRSTPARDAVLRLGNKVGRIAASWIVACMPQGQAFRDSSDPDLVGHSMSGEHVVTCHPDLPVTLRGGRASPYPATVGLVLFLNLAEQALLKSKHYPSPALLANSAVPSF